MRIPKTVFFFDGFFCGFGKYVEPLIWDVFFVDMVNMWSQCYHIWHTYPDPTWDSPWARTTAVSPSRNSTEEPGARPHASALTMGSPVTMGIPQISVVYWLVQMTFTRFLMVQYIYIYENIWLVVVYPPL